VLKIFTSVEPVPPLPQKWTILCWEKQYAVSSGLLS